VAGDVLKVLLVGQAEAGWSADGIDLETAGVLPARVDHDAVVLEAPDADALRALLQRSDLGPLCLDTAVVVLAPTASLDDRRALLRLGVQDIVGEAQGAALGRALQHAVERKRVERASRPAYATDLATGLPHAAQLLEHASQLIALRERDPAPTVLIVLRIEGLASAARRFGDAAAHALRRKVAVRLRTGLRASDVVAAIAPDRFAVLLGHVESLADGETVVAKLVQALHQPFQVAGQSCAIAVAAGMARHPDDGRDAAALLQHATRQAQDAAASGREGFASYAERGPARAANDDAGEGLT